MFGFSKKQVQPQQPVCAIINALCPETNNPDSALAKSSGRYCPNWVEGIMETHTDNIGRFNDIVYRGCFLPKLPNYLVGITANANHAGASADKAATEAHKAHLAADSTTLALKHVGRAIGVPQDAQGLLPVDIDANQLPESLEGGNSTHRGGL